MWHWLQDYNVEIKTITTILQGIVIIGGIGIAIQEFVLSGKIEERDRVRNTLPLLENVYKPEFILARTKISEISFEVMNDQMSGGEPQSPEFVPLQKWLPLERDMSTIVRPLAGYYEMMAHCVIAEACSARVAFQSLCKDASQLQVDISAIKRHVERRYTREEEGVMPKWERQERENRIYDKLMGFTLYTSMCRKWNENNPKFIAPIIEGSFKAPP